MFFQRTNQDTQRGLLRVQPFSRPSYVTLFRNRHERPELVPGEIMHIRHDMYFEAFSVWREWVTSASLIAQLTRKTS